MHELDIVVSEIGKNFLVIREQAEHKSCTELGMNFVRQEFKVMPN